MFAKRGWTGTRIEDLAREAGVSVATAYNHFPGGKQELIGVIYSPLLRPLIERARLAVAREDEPVDAISDYVAGFISVARENLGLTLPLAAAVTDQAIRADGPPHDDHDVRRLVPLVQPLAELIEYGQEVGTFPRAPGAQDVAAYHANSMLLRVLGRPHEPAETTTSLVLSQLLPALGAIAQESVLS